MAFYLEPVNLRYWDFFEETERNSVVHMPAARNMQFGDIVLIHIRGEFQESGIYGYGRVILGPHLLEDRPRDFCDGKLAVDVQIEKIQYDKPIITHTQFRRFTGQYRTAHVLSSGFDAAIKNLLGIS